MRCRKQRVSMQIPRPEKTQSGMSNAHVGRERDDLPDRKLTACSVRNADRESRSDHKVTEMGTHTCRKTSWCGFESERKEEATPDRSPHCSVLLLHCSATARCAHSEKTYTPTLDTCRAVLNMGKIQRDSFRNYTNLGHPHLTGSGSAPGRTTAIGGVSVRPKRPFPQTPPNKASISIMFARAADRCQLSTQLLDSDI